MSKPAKPNLRTMSTGIAPSNAAFGDDIQPPRDLGVLRIEQLQRFVDAEQMANAFEQIAVGGQRFALGITLQCNAITFVQAQQHQLIGGAELPKLEKLCHGAGQHNSFITRPGRGSGINILSMHKPAPCV